ncbi:restriction endonuclease fold toxin 5 domain-containing protein [Arthrobacter sp. StoSoilB22]|uniref:restriction endonuclease fold toxin 5 domain-containing protein n=1 Tax=Arthrobacter sp. StoSoilB22 TaxID=2830996 RepID=UPI001CC3C98B|nr:restriction endonuclease fold toxin 5 domain-containing protein [Arthrobacter sp. StoSoilB22]BCW62164.1 hypothetical protein StoSoilB22_11370 [Arthrobacter sp. StoSoilB22]
MDFSQVCAAGPGASGISVDGLPPLPDPDALDSHGQALAASGNAVHSGVNDAAKTWAGLAGAYEAPEAGQVLTAFNPVFSRSQDLANLTGKTATVLAAYADRARELKQRITTLRAEVHALDELIGGNDDWRSNLKIVDQHRNTMDKASALAQAILDSDATCATALAALTGGQSYAPPTIPRANLNSSTDFISNAFTHVQHYLGADEKLPDLPWGPPNISVRLAGPASAAQGFTSALIGAGQGLHTLLLTTDTAKQALAWQGMFAIGAAALTTKNVIDRGFKDASPEDINAVLTTVNVAKETIHYDEWGTNPGYAIGATTFDVGSMFIGGTGLGIKGASLGGKLGAETAALTKAATLSKGTTSITGATRSVLGEATAAVAAKLTQARTAIWDHGIGTALNKLDTGLAKLNQTLNGPQPAYAGAPHQLPTPVPETAWLAKVDETSAAGAKAKPAPEPFPRIVDQTLGDPALPGRHPDLQPAIGDTDGGPGSWQEPGGRNDKGVPDQIFGTGVTATGPKGYLLEYFIDYVKADGSVGKVEFDGHLWRGHPPAEVYQEIKGNYDLLFRGVYDGRYLRSEAVPTAIREWVQDRVAKQIEALEAKAPGAHLEWIFTQNEDLAKIMDKAVTQYLARNHVSVTVDVKFAPMKG